MIGDVLRFCTQCGRANEAGGKFCDSCGADLRVGTGADPSARSANSDSAASAHPAGAAPPPPPPPPPPIASAAVPYEVPPAAAVGSPPSGGRSRSPLIALVIGAVLIGCGAAWWWLGRTTDSSASGSESESGPQASSQQQSETASTPPPAELTATGVYSGKMYGSSYTYDFTMTVKEDAKGGVTGKVFEQQIGGNSCSGTEVVEGKRSGSKITLDGKYFTSDSACYSRWSGYEDDFELRLSADGEKIEGRYWCYACSTTGPFEMSGRRR